MDFLAHGRVTEVAELGRLECPCTVRVLGLLLARADHADTIVLAGLDSTSQVLVDVSGCPATPLRLHTYYEVIGELAPFSSGHIIRARVLQEAKTSRMSVDFYVRQVQIALEQLEAQVRSNS